MLSKAKVAFIGSGLMAESIVKMLLTHKVCPPADILMSDIRRNRIEELQEKYGVIGFAENVEAAKSADIVFLSIKPQTLPSVLPDLRGHLRSTQVIVSIVAGATVAYICSGIQHDRVIRVMTNTPAQIGEAVSLWVATPKIEASIREQVKCILSSFGKEIEVEDELYIDRATGISGPGPAYVFLFIEALVDAGVRLGFERAIAQELVLQTVIGSAHLMEVTKKHPAELRNSVASPGGPCATALQALEKDAFRGILGNAVWIAYQRSVELGKEVTQTKVPEQTI